VLRRVLSLLVLALAIAPASRAQLAAAETATPEGRVRVKYWEKWTGMEKDAMEAVVQDFNRSQSAYPVMSSVVYSFCDYSVLSPPKWIGLQNFADPVPRSVPSSGS
jgi:hypothetical protein